MIHGKGGNCDLSVQYSLEPVKECAPSVPVSRLIGHSVFGYCFGSVNDATCDNIHEEISLGRSLMCNDAAVFGGRMDLNMFVRDLSEWWKSFEIDSEIIFLVPFMCS